MKEFVLRVETFSKSTRIEGISKNSVTVASGKSSASDFR
jgi:hypothetical protein